MSTDYRALCAELLAALEIQLDELRFNNRLCVRARAALAQPEPVAPNSYRFSNSTRDLGTWPSREEILALGAELDERYDVDHGDVDLVRAALARWGTPAIEPVPVSERLPEPEDCDAEGGCWWWHPDHKEDDFDDGWILLNPKWADGRRDSDDSLIYTHWLPANALPNPEATND